MASELSVFMPQCALHQQCGFSRLRQKIPTRAFDDDSSGGHLKAAPADKIMENDCGYVSAMDYAYGYKCPECMDICCPITSIHPFMPQVSGSCLQGDKSH